MGCPRKAPRTLSSDWPDLLSVLSSPSAKGAHYVLQIIHRYGLPEMPEAGKGLCYRAASDPRRDCNPVRAMRQLRRSGSSVHFTKASQTA